MFSVPHPRFFTRLRRAQNDIFVQSPFSTCSVFGFPGNPMLGNGMEFDKRCARIAAGADGAP